ncbi:MAG: GNAT family N-acetyltransferase [Firmicutes bacterium]|nr:GNAT family N-acetyltransferase [Bacillota bacterium]
MKEMKRKMRIIIKKVSSKTELEDVLALREEIFIEEQGIDPALERDSYDQAAVHVLAREGSKVIACGRVIFNDSYGKIGRVAVAKSWRKQGIGRKICQKIIAIADERNCSRLVLEAQVDAIDFYRKLGFETSGDIFQEAGIEHIKMTATL